MTDGEHERQPATNDEEEIAPEDVADEPGAEGGSKSPAADRPAGLPSRDDSPLGDTDQHSDA